MNSPDAPRPGQTPDGAEEWQVPAQVRPASEILSEMFATATSQGDRMDPADRTRMADAFVEGVVELLTRTLYDRARLIRECISPADLPEWKLKVLNAASDLEGVGSAIEGLLPPDKRIGRRQNV